MTVLKALNARALIAATLLTLLAAPATHASSVTDVLPIAQAVESASAYVQEEDGDFPWGLLGLIGLLGLAGLSGKRDERAYAKDPAVRTDPKRRAP